MLIKSRSLLPDLQLTDEEEMDVKELELRLKTYKFFKELAGHLKELNNQNKHLFGREAYAGMSAVFFPPKGLAPAILKKILGEILEAIPQKEILPEESILKAVSLEDKMTELKERLLRFMPFTFSAIGGFASGGDD